MRLFWASSCRASCRRAAAPLSCWCAEACATSMPLMLRVLLTAGCKAPWHSAEPVLSDCSAFNQFTENNKGGS